MNLVALGATNMTGLHLGKRIHEDSGGDTFIGTLWWLKYSCNTRAFAFPDGLLSKSMSPYRGWPIRLVSIALAEVFVKPITCGSAQGNDQTNAAVISRRKFAFGIAVLFF